MSREGWIPGDPWGICDRCGQKRRRSQLARDGQSRGTLLVCEDECQDRRHPQESVRAVSDKIAVRNARPRPDRLYVGAVVLLERTDASEDPVYQMPCALLLEQGGKVTLEQSVVVSY